MSIYSFQARRLSGEETDLAPYRGKTMLIVNTASACGLTPQYEGLQKLHEKYYAHGLRILGFPCNQFGEQEPGTSEQIAEFCRSRYDVSFDMFEKVEVNGPNAHPLYQYLKRQAPGEAGEDGDIQWNFTKFLVDREGRVAARFEPSVTPEEIEPAIRAQLQLN